MDRGGLFTPEGEISSPVGPEDHTAPDGGSPVIDSLRGSLKEDQLTAISSILLYNQMKNRLKTLNSESSLFRLQRYFNALCKILFAIIGVTFLFMMIVLYPCVLYILFDQFRGFDYFANGEGMVY